jgi:hypothetical protein
LIVAVLAENRADEPPAVTLLVLGLFFVNMRGIESLGALVLSIGEAPARELVETAPTNQANSELRHRWQTRASPEFGVNLRNCR